MRKICLLILLSSFLFATADIQALRSQVIGYNKGIVQAAKTSKVEHLHAFVTKELATKIYLWIKAYHDDNLFMEAIVNKIEFENIASKREENTAIVKTKEQWRYRYINIKNKKEVHPPTKIFYEVEYKFIFLNKKWIIHEINVLDERQEEI